MFDAVLWPCTPHRCAASGRVKSVLPLVLVVSVLSMALAPRAANATPPVAALAKQLKKSDDYRIRTQAALALGASGDAAAVKPLCGAVEADANVSVRGAAAAALGKLGKVDGLTCLKTAEGKEVDDSVKAQIAKSITAIEGAASSSGPDAPPPPGPDAKFYVAIQVVNKTNGSEDEVDGVVRSAMQAKLLGKKGYAVAPKAETPAQAGKVVKSKKLKGYLLIATVEPPVYAAGDLSQTVRVSLWTWPDKALQGEFAPKLTQSGTPKQDTQSEKLLMKMCSEAAVESFVKVAHSL